MLSGPFQFQGCAPLYIARFQSSPWRFERGFLHGGSSHSTRRSCAVDINMEAACSRSVLHIEDDVLVRARQSWIGGAPFSVIALPVRGEALRGPKGKVQVCVRRLQLVIDRHCSGT